MCRIRGLKAAGLRLFRHRVPPPPGRARQTQLIKLFFVVGFWSTELSKEWESKRENFLEIDS